MTAHPFDGVVGPTPLPPGRYGVGAGAEIGGALELVRATVEDVRLAGIMSGASRSVVRATDVTVRRIDVQMSDGLAACGLCAASDARLEVERALVDHVHGMGVGIGNSASDGSVFIGHDVRVVDTLSADGRQLRTGGGTAPFVDLVGYGLGVLGAGAELTRFVVERAAIVGISASFGGDIVGSDVVVSEGTGRTSDGDYGYGVFASVGARIELLRVRASDNRVVGVGADTQSALLLEDALVERTQADPMGRYGHGLQLETSASATVSNMEVRQSRDIGVMVSSASLDATGLRVIDTRAQACADSGCPGAGVGVGSYLDSNVVISDFVVSGSALCGIQLARDGAMDLHQGEVAFSPIGANVDVAGFDVARLSDRVVYHDNERNLDSVNLPVPEASIPPAPTVGGP